MNEALESIDAFKVANLFHDLSNLIDDDNDVPCDVNNIVEDFKDAQNKFLLKIDEYMHRYNCRRLETEIKTDETIIKACPAFLASKNEEDLLPIHCVVRNENDWGCAFKDGIEAEFVPILAKYGVENKIFDSTSRGGLLEDENVLQEIREVETFQSLARMDPPLFLPEDVVEQDLLHARKFSSLNMTRWLISINPSALYTYGYYSKGLPLHYYPTYRTETIRLLLEEAMKFDPSHPSIGGLFSRDHRGVFAIEGFKRLKAVAQVMSQYEHIPILHKVIEHTPKLVDKIITFCPHSTTIRDENGRLPIHIALEKGFKTSLELAAIMSANAEHLGVLDPVTNFCPSALAAMEPSCDLDTIYRLLRGHPSHVDQGRKRTLSTNPAVNSSKLQKTRR